MQLFSVHEVLHKLKNTKTKNKYFALDLVQRWHLRYSLFTNRGIQKYCMKMSQKVAPIKAVIIFLSMNLNTDLAATASFKAFFLSLCLDILLLYIFWHDYIQEQASWRIKVVHLAVLKFQGVGIFCLSWCLLLGTLFNA